MTVEEEGKTALYSACVHQPKRVTKGEPNGRRVEQDREGSYAEGIIQIFLRLLLRWIGL
jgi:hypothetical protein